MLGWLNKSSFWYHGMSVCFVTNHLAILATGLVPSEGEPATLERFAEGFFELRPAGALEDELRPAGALEDVHGRGFHDHDYSASSRA
jgi:hypothetical protein